MGSHSSLITLFEDVTRDLSTNLTFGYGSADDFNSGERRYPYVWLDPMTGNFPSDSTVSNIIRWNCTLNFLKLDDKVGNEKETAIVWDEMFDIMEKWIHKLDREFLNDETDSRIQSGNIELQDVRFNTLKKGTRDLVSGWVLSFTVITQSNFTYCSIYES